MPSILSCSFPLCFSSPCSTAALTLLCVSCCSFIAQRWHLPDRWFVPLLKSWNLNSIRDSCPALLEWLFLCCYLICLPHERITIGRRYLLIVQVWRIFFFFFLIAGFIFSDILCLFFGEFKLLYRKWKLIIQYPLVVVVISSPNPKSNFFH